MCLRKPSMYGMDGVPNIHVSLKAIGWCDFSQRNSIKLFSVFIITGKETCLSISAIWDDAIMAESLFDHALLAWWASSVILSSVVATLPFTSSASWSIVDLEKHMQWAYERKWYLVRSNGKKRKLARQNQIILIPDSKQICVCVILSEHWKPASRNTQIYHPPLLPLFRKS